jgi:hypothetical protein
MVVSGLPNIAYMKILAKAEEQNIQIIRNLDNASQHTLQIEHRTLNTQHLTLNPTNTPIFPRLRQ